MCLWWRITYPSLNTARMLGQIMVVEYSLTYLKKQQIFRLRGKHTITEFLLKQKGQNARKKSVQVIRKTWRSSKLDQKICTRKANTRQYQSRNSFSNKNTYNTTNTKNTIIPIILMILIILIIFRDNTNDTHNANNFPG